MIAGRTLSAAVVATGFCLAAALAQAQTYPLRPIRIIVPTPAGGPVDVIARLTGNYLTIAVGQPVVIDNRPGAGNTLGSKEAAQAEPDGYTLLYSSASGLVLAPMLQKNAGYDSLTSYDPIALVAHATINDGVRSAELKAALAKLNNEPLGGTPQDFTDTIKADIAKWAPVVKALGLKAE
jgi:tripartite-type tricarboxylate transporter receptor subunit TctC